MDKYIGLDVHATSCTAAVVDARGKRLGSHVIETNGQALVESRWFKGTRVEQKGG
jgi:predicted NBD/HSP70 family sugar kinase